MKEYLLLFWNESGDGQYLLTAEKLKQSMAAWQAWIGNIAMNGNLISTKPINWDGAMISNAGVANKPSIKEKVMVTGYMICKAKDIDQVKEWASTCPILESKAGYTEIREVSPFEM
ncbi:MAG TPA: YciI family protein [Cyclobacteriaceae bacterium]|nr:YciI family protein [Cyclobacteriaceae bacterium]